MMQVSSGAAVHARKPIALVSLLLAAFAINLDTTIVNVALPTLVRELNVSPEAKYGDVKQRVNRAIEDHFKVRLNRPELLNRIGDKAGVSGAPSSGRDQAIERMDLFAW